MFVLFDLLLYLSFFTIIVRFSFSLFSIAFESHGIVKVYRQKNDKRIIITFSNSFSYFVYSDNKAKENCKMHKNGI